MTPEEWDLLGDLYERSFNVTESEREELIRSAGISEEVAEELRALWAAPPSLAFLADPVVRQAPPDRPWDPHAEPGAGLRFGPYRTERVLGEGGMGTVYLAVQDQFPERRVALKVVRTGIHSDEVLRRFEFERQTLALMNHPGIAQILDAGTAEDGRPFFVMEYVDGVPVTTYCDQHRLGFRERLSLFRQLCLAVHHAHQRGIIHRDLKPSNVLVATVDGMPVPRVIDWGIARAVEKDRHRRSALTEAGLLVGTPQYMSPEQALGDPDELDTTSDVYSLGILLYELLVGVVPFDVNDLRRPGIDAICRAILEDAAPSPTARLSSLGLRIQEVAVQRGTTARGLMKSLRGDLEWIVLKALEKSRERRYRSASELGEDVERHLSNQPVAAGPPSLTYELWKFASRHRVQVTSAVSLLILFAVGAVTTAVLYARVREARDLAEHHAYKAVLAAAQSSVAESRTAEARDILFSIPRSQRSWEWKHLYWLTDTTRRTWQAGEGAFPGYIAYTAADSTLTVATSTSVHRWSLDEDRRVADYGPFGTVVGLAPDGSAVAVRSKAGPMFGIDVIRVLDGTVAARLTGHPTAVVDASFSAGGQRVATLGTDNSVRVWDIPSAALIASTEPLRPPMARQDGLPMERIALSPDASMVAATDFSRIRLIEARTGRQRALLEGGTGAVQSVLFSGDGQRLFTSSESLRVWDSRTGELLHRMQRTPVSHLLGAAVDPATGLVATSSWLRGVTVWERTQGDPVVELAAGPMPLCTLHWTSDGKYLIGVETRGAVRVWDGPTLGGQVLRRVTNQNAREMTTSAYGFRRSARSYGSADSSPDGSRIAVGSGSSIELVATRDGSVLASAANAHSAPVAALSFSPDGRSLASGGQDRMLCLWSGDSLSRKLCVEGAHEDAITRVVFAEKGSLIVSAGLDKRVRVWDAATLTRRYEYQTQGPVRSLAVSPDDKSIAFGWTYAGGALDLPLFQVLDVSSGQGRPLENRQHVAGAAWALTFSRDGRYLFVSDSGALGTQIWDSTSGKRAGVFETAGHQAVGCRWFALSPDNSRLTGTYPDGTLSIMDSKSRELLTQFFGRTGLHTFFSPDGKDLYINRYQSIEVLRSEPVISPDAEELVRQLRKRFALNCDIREHLHAADLDERVKQDALRILDHAPENYRLITEQMDSVLFSGKGPARAYDLALRRARMISESEPWNDAVRLRLGASLFRAGDYEQAANVLQKVRYVSARDALATRVFATLVERKRNRAVSSQMRDRLKAEAAKFADDGSLQRIVRELEETAEGSDGRR